MSLRCVFRLCKWRHLFNVKDAENNFGVYQCPKCKTVSIGSSRDLIHPKEPESCSRQPEHSAD